MVFNQKENLEQKLMATSATKSSLVGKDEVR